MVPSAPTQNGPSYVHLLWCKVREIGRRTRRENPRNAWSYRESIVVRTQFAPLYLSAVHLSGSPECCITLIGHFFFTCSNRSPEWCRLAPRVHRLSPAIEVPNQWVDSSLLIHLLTPASVRKVLGNKYSDGRVEIPWRSTLAFFISDCDSQVCTRCRYQQWQSLATSPTSRERSACKPTIVWV